MNILFSTNLPTSYFVEFAEELSKYVNLTVVFERNFNLHTNQKCIENFNSFHFKSIILNSKSRSTKENIVSFKITQAIKRIEPDFVIFGNPCSPTGILGELYCKRNNIKYIVHSEGGFLNDKKNIKEWIKRFVMKNACMFFTGMSSDNNYFLKYGAKPTTLKKFNFSSLHNSDIDIKPFTKIEKAELRKKYKIEDKLTLLCVAQIIERKGVDILLDVYSKINDNVQLLIIGGEATPALENIIADKKIKNVFFIPRIDKNNLSNYYRMADIFILLTREDIWGLVINEAMSKGLPIITSNRCNAGIELIKNGVNGFIVDINNIDEVLDATLLLIKDEKMRETMGKNNLTKIKEYTIERMAEQIARHLNDYE